MKTLISVMNRAAKAAVFVIAPLATVDSVLAADWFVDANITNPGSGLLGWSDALKYLSDAIAQANPAGGDVIKVKGAPGTGLTYVTDRSAADQDGSCTPGPCDPAISFTIDKQVVIRGQHTGTNPQDPDERNPTYRTILSGAISASESSYSVVRFVGSLDSLLTKLDGLEIRDGVADGGLVNPDYGRGGGIHVGGSAPDIRACRIIGNRAVPNLPSIPNEGPQDGLGGGVFAGNGATLTLRGCEVANNIGLYGGGFVLTTCH